MTAKKMRDAALIEKLMERHGMATVAVLEDGREVVFYDMVWGYDLGDNFAHIQTNWGPKFEKEPFEFFYTNELVELLDHDTRRSIFRFPI